MDLQTIQMLLKLMEEHDLAELEVEREGETIRLRKKESQPPPQVVALSPQQVPQPQPSSTPSEPPTDQLVQQKVLPEISSPMVGTFYSRPDPESPPYVEVGDVVEPNTVVCIIEAMKVMNEIRAEASGRVAEILVSDGEPIEFGQSLFRIESLP